METFRGKQRDEGKVEVRLASVRVMAVKLIEVAESKPRRYLGW